MKFYKYAVEYVNINVYIVSRIIRFLLHLRKFWTLNSTHNRCFKLSISNIS